MATFKLSQFQGAQTGNTTTTAAPPKKLNINSFQGATMSAPTPPAAPPKQSFGSWVSGALGNFSEGVAKAEVGAVQGIGQAVLSGTDALGITKDASKNTFLKDPNALQPQGKAQTVGDVVGTIAPYLTGAGEAEGATLAAETVPKVASALGKQATDFIPKAAGWLAEHLPTFGANTAIGTAQTGNLKSGTESGVGAEVGQTVLGKVGSYIANRGARVLQGLNDALTPRVVGQTYNKAAGSGIFKPKNPSIFGKAGVDGDTVKSVQRAVQAVQNVASALGQKATDIIKSGSGQITKNFNRINDTIGKYAQTVVKPFLQKAGVNYNFSDLRSALELIKPSTDLKGDALAAYNQVRERILSAVANKVTPEVRGGKNLTTLRSLVSGDGTVPPKATQGDTDFWDGRKIIDDIIKEEKTKVFSDSEKLSGVEQAYRDLRAGYKNYLSDAFRYPGQMENVNRANEFLATQQSGKMDKTGWDISQFEKQFGLMPNAQSVENQNAWDSYMANLEGLYQGRSNLSTGLNTERDKNSLQLWAKAHPTATKAAIGVGTTVGGIAGYDELKSKLPFLP